MLNIQAINSARNNAPQLKLFKNKATNPLKLKPQLTKDTFQLSFGSKLTAKQDAQDDTYSFNMLLDKVEELRSTEPTYRIQELSNFFLYRALFCSTNIADFLAERQLDCETSLELLYHLCQDEKMAFFLVEGLTSNPKNSQEIYDKLVSSVVSSKKDEQLFNSWFYDEVAGYKHAYMAYFDHMLADKSVTLNDMVKFTPNIAPWKLAKKAKDLGTGFTIGRLPEENESLPYQLRYKRDYREFVHTLEYMQTGEEWSFGYNNENKVKLLTGSASTKRIYKIETKNDGCFILKADPYCPKDQSNDYYWNKVRENFDLRADMPYLNAMIDFYLKFNGYQDNVADVQFYDHLTGSILYKATEGEECTDLISPTAFRNIYLSRQYPIVEEFKKVGIYLNDIHDLNFMKDNNGNLVLIDSGHAEFKDPLKPLIEGQVQLSNLCGRTI